MLGSLSVSERERRVNIMLGRAPPPQRGSDPLPGWWRGSSLAEAAQRRRGSESPGEGAERDNVGGVSLSARHETGAATNASNSAGKARAALSRLEREERDHEAGMARMAEIQSREEEELQRKLASHTADLDSWVERVGAVQEQVQRAREEEGDQQREEGALAAATERMEAECRMLDSEAAAHRERARLAWLRREERGMSDGMAEASGALQRQRAEVSEAQELLGNLRGEILRRQAALQRIREAREEQERRAKGMKAELDEEIREMREVLRAQALQGRQAQAELYRQRILQEQQRQALCRSIQQEVLLQGQERVMRVEGILEEEMKEERARAQMASQMAQEANNEEKEAEKEARRLREQAEREEAETTRRRIEALHSARMAELQCKLARAVREVSRAHRGVRETCEMVEAATELSSQLASTLDRMQTEHARGKAGSKQGGDARRWWYADKERRVVGKEGWRVDEDVIKAREESSSGDEAGGLGHGSSRKQQEDKRGWGGAGASRGSVVRPGSSARTRRVAPGVNPRYRQQLLRLQLHALKASREAD